MISVLYMLLDIATLQGAEIKTLGLHNVHHTTVLGLYNRSTSAVVVVNSLFANASLHSGTKTAYWQVSSLYIKTQ